MVVDKPEGPDLGDQLQRRSVRGSKSRGSELRVSDSPSDWERFGFLGGLIFGIAWAITKFQSWLGGNKEEPTQRRVTPLDVLNELKDLRAEMRLIRAEFEAFRDEESRVHQAIEIQLRDALNYRR